MQYTTTTAAPAARPWLATAELAALDARLAAKCSPSDLRIYRRFIFGGQPDPATAAMRYTETLASIRRANRRKGRARARWLAKDRDAYNQWLAGTTPAESPAELVYEPIPF